MLADLDGQALDLIMLPEMALVGYRFEDRADVAPYTETVPADISALIDSLDEPEADAPCSFKWALRVSKRFAPAWVAVGFAERDTADNYFNSALVVNHELRVCHVIRKTLHFHDDKKWATLEASVSGIEYNY